MMPKTPQYDQVDTFNSKDLIQSLNSKLAEANQARAVEQHRNLELKCLVREKDLIIENRDMAIAAKDGEIANMDQMLKNNKELIQAQSKLIFELLSKKI